MDLPTYTNIWRIEKRLYKLYDLRLPMPLPLVQIGVFLGVFVPWILLLRLFGIPFESPWHVLYIVPPGVLTWLATRPVIEGKRLTELLLSQGRYLAEPRTWCRLTPIREPREVVIVARVWRRAEAPAPVAAAERAAIKSRRKRRAAAQPAAAQPAAAQPAAAQPAAAQPAVMPAPAMLARPTTAAAPPPLAEYAAHPVAEAPAAPPKPWRRTTRDISHEDDVQPVPAELEHPPATPRLEAPPSGKRALASGIRRPGAPAEFWQATPPPTRPDIPQQPRADVRRAAEEIANGTSAPRPPASGEHQTARPTGQTPTSDGAQTPPPAPDESSRPRAAERGETPVSGTAQPRQSPPPVPGEEPGVRVAGRASGGATPVSGAGQSRQVPPPTPGEEPGVRVAGRGSGGDVPVSDGGPSRPGDGERDVADGATRHERREPVWSDEERRRDVRQEPGVPAAEPRRSGGEAGDKKVAGEKTPAPRPEAEPVVPPAAAQAPSGGPGVRETRRDLPRPWAPPQRGAGRPPAARPEVPGPTRPDIPMVPGAFGARSGEAAGLPPAGPPPAAGTPRMEAPRPWSEGLSKPRPASDGPAWPAAPEAVPEAGPAPDEQPPPVEEQAPPREVRSQPASPVRPRPLPPPPAPPPSGPAITPPDPEHEVSGGGLRRLFHAVGGGHGDVDAEYQQRLQQPFHGTRHVVVLGCTGGAGQTVTALMLGHTFAQHNGEPVVAIDVNPGPGALARRTRSDTNETLTGLITRADQVGSLTAMRRYTSQAKSGLDVIAAGKNPLQALDDRDYALAIRTIDKFYSVTLLDAAAAVVARVLPYADQIVLVAPASADAPRAVAMTFEWLDGHGYEELRSRAVTVINGVSRRSMDDVEQAEAVARGRCRALVRIPWDDHLSMDRAPRNELKSLRTPTRRAYLALAGVVAGGFTVMPERYQELQQEQEATR